MADRQRRLDQQFLAEVARQYNAHIAAGWPPIRAIAVAHGVTWGTAANWVGVARHAGHHLDLGATGLRHNYPYRSIA